MDISTRKPLIWPLVKIFFPAAKWGEVIVTWGRKIYCKVPFGEDLLAHETIHLMQQNFSYWRGIIWWFKYIYSAAFRLSQEIPAHEKQWEVICRCIKDRNRREHARRALATALSSAIYRNMISFSDAYKLFK